MLGAKRSLTCSFTDSGVIIYTKKQKEEVDAKEQQEK